jgi:hypothetical protein
MIDLVIAIPDRPRHAGEQFLEISLPLDQRQSRQVLAVQVEQIEAEKDERCVAVFEGILDQVEGGATIGQDTTEFAIQVRSVGRQRGECAGDRRVLIRPVVAASCKDFHSTSFQSSVHAVAVELNFVQPIGAGRGLLHERRELGLDPGR